MTDGKSASGWFVYILECADGSFYTGATNDPELRLAQHNRGRGSRYTRARLPVRLVYLEAVADRSSALRLEYAIKSLPRSQKAALAAGAGNGARTAD